jgi:hypothetical protein
MSREGWGAYQKYDSDDDFDAFSAVKMATDRLKGPAETLAATDRLERKERKYFRAVHYTSQSHPHTLKI